VKARESESTHRIAKGLADSVNKPSDMLGRAFYPEVMRLDFATKHPWRLMMRGASLSGAIGALAILVIVVGGEPLMRLVFGPSFVGAFPVLLVLLTATLMTMIAFPVVSMFYALDRPGLPLIARVAGVAAYLAVIVPLATALGAVGAALAFVIGNFVDLAIKIFSLRRQYVRVRVRK
jgi:O-antigen/teichoic acid export membrane protein